ELATRERAQPRAQVLPSDARGTSAARARRIEMETDGRRGRPRDAAETGWAVMKAWNELASLVALLRHRRRRLAEFNRELEADLALEADEQLESGVPPADARDAARRAFGNATLVAEDV